MPVLLSAASPNGQAPAGILKVHQMTEAIATRLELLGLAVRHRLRASQLAGEIHRFHEAVAHEGGDTIFWIDRKVDEAIPFEVAAWPDALLPVELVMEGLGESGQRRIGDEHEPLKYRLMIDPIDGTRNIMFDKRSGWFLAALAPAHRADGAEPVALSRPQNSQNCIGVWRRRLQRCQFVVSWCLNPKFLI